MTREEMLACLGGRPCDACKLNEEGGCVRWSCVFEEEPDEIDKSAMLSDIYMEGVNMTGEYHGCWVRFKDIEKIVDKYFGEGGESE